MARQLATTRSISAQARAFCDAYVNDPETAGNASASARKAGFAVGSCGQEGYRLLRHDGVRAEVHRLTLEALGDHAAAAVQLLGRVVRDERAPLKIRVDAAKAVLDRAGFVAPKAPEPLEPSEKEIAEMSMAELQAFLKEAKEQVAAEKRLLDVTPLAIEEGPSGD